MALQAIQWSKEKEKEKEEEKKEEKEKGRGGEGEKEDDKEDKEEEKRERKEGGGRGKRRSVPKERMVLPKSGVQQLSTPKGPGRICNWVQCVGCLRQQSEEILVYARPADVV